MFFNKSAKLLKQREEELIIVQGEMHLLKGNHHAIETELKQTKEELQKTQTELNRISTQNTNLINKYSDILDKDKILIERHAEIERLEKKIVELNERYKSAIETFTELEKQIALYKDSLRRGGCFLPPATDLWVNHDDEKEIPLNTGCKELRIFCNEGRHS